MEILLLDVNGDLFYDDMNMGDNNTNKRELQTIAGFSLHPINTCVQHALSNNVNTTSR